jgi:hypothetical protein
MQTYCDHSLSCQFDDFSYKQYEKAIQIAHDRLMVYKFAGL